MLSGGSETDQSVRPCIVSNGVVVAERRQDVLVQEPVAVSVEPGPPLHPKHGRVYIVPAVLHNGVTKLVTPKFGPHGEKRILSVNLRDGVAMALRT